MFQRLETPRTATSREHDEHDRRRQHVALSGYLTTGIRRCGPCGPYMPRGLRAGFRFDAMIRRASRRWLSSASSAI